MIAEPVKLSNCQTAMCVTVQGMSKVYPVGQRFGRHVLKLIRAKYPHSNVDLISTAVLIKRRNGDAFYNNIVPAGTFARQNPKPKWDGPHSSSDFTPFLHDQPHQNHRFYGPGERQAIAEQKAVKKAGKTKRKERLRAAEKAADSLIAELFG